jgi:hypothetical protein
MEEVTTVVGFQPLRIVAVVEVEEQELVLEVLEVLESSLFAIGSNYHEHDPCLS